MVEWMGIQPIINRLRNAYFLANVSTVGMRSSGSETVHWVTITNWLWGDANIIAILTIIAPIKCGRYVKTNKMDLSNLITLVIFID